MCSVLARLLAFATLGVALAPTVDAQGNPAQDVATPGLRGRQVALAPRSGGVAAHLTATLHDNGPFVNSPGTGAGGADESVLQTVSLGMWAFGFAVSAGPPNDWRLADDFTIHSPRGWRIDEVVVYAYVTGSTTASPFTDARLEIWDGDPSVPGHSRVFGDMTTNRLRSTAWTRAYRVTETSGGDTTRPIMANTITVGTTLRQGTYWLVWSLGVGPIGWPYAPPITITGQAVTGDALHFDGAAGTWDRARDGGTGTPPQGMPFTILGEDLSPPCFEPDYGRDLRLGDDQLGVGVNLGFAFPLPGGLGTTSLIDVSSNGFVYLQSGISTSHGCCNGDPTALRQGPARIATAWMDLNPTAGGAVYFNAFRNPSRAVVTWAAVPEYPNDRRNTVQLQMFDDGAFTINVWELTAPGTHDLLMGVSPGNGAADPGEIDYSVLPVDTGASGTVYEWFDAPAEPRDLAGKFVLFTPNGLGGFHVVDLPQCSGAARAVAYGQGCPQSPAAYEVFEPGQLDLQGWSYMFVPQGGGYAVTFCRPPCFDSNLGVDLRLGDDQLSQALALNFLFPAPGGNASNAVEVSSNGFVNLFPFLDPNAGCCHGDVGAFLAGPARIAGLWQDLDPSAAGAVHFRATLSRAVITWSGVPEYGHVAAPMTFQIQLFPDGQFRLVWLGDVANATHRALVGYSAGGGTFDPNPTDWTVRVPFTTGPFGTPLALSAQPAPVVGATITLTTANLPTSARVGAVLLGFAPASVPLASIGMGGCSLLQGSDLTSLGVALPGGATPLPIPNLPGLIGAAIFAQSAVIAPGANALGVLASNGVELRMGSF